MRVVFQEASVRTPLLSTSQDPVEGNGSNVSIVSDLLGSPHSLSATDALFSLSLSHICRRLLFSTSSSSSSSSLSLTLSLSLSPLPLGLCSEYLLASLAKGRATGRGREGGKKEAVDLPLCFLPSFFFFPHGTHSQRLYYALLFWSAPPYPLFSSFSSFHPASQPFSTLNSPSQIHGPSSCVIVGT